MLTQSYCILFDSTPGPARHIARTACHINGLYNLFQLGCRMTKARDTIISMHRVIHMEITEDDSEGHLLVWEREVARCSLSSSITCTSIPASLL